ncbi:MAG TPA: 2Fe-2S iron-sulfur cluster-binding protein [Thermoplasmata archaeon]|nr:2Fe-2S iron-sulfur cluster-binding protein [Thermoplasmata archaeon]
MTASATVRVNGSSHSLAKVPEAERLLDTLRWRLGLRGTKEGCRTGGCGACTVLVDGLPTLSCLTLTHELDGCDVTTVEGLDEDPVARKVKQAFIEEGASQCGYCTPGFVVALVGQLHQRGEKADAASLMDDLQGNLCRCTGYASIGRAVRRIVESR